VATNHPLNLTTGVTEVVATERTPLLDRKIISSSRPPSIQSLPVGNGVDISDASINRTRLLLAISFASFSGIISGMCLLFAKSGVELLLLTLQGHNQFWRWQAWVLVLGLVVFALLQLWYLHKALILANPTLVCPCEWLHFHVVLPLFDR
jgi:magnesium transporter